MQRAHLSQDGYRPCTICPPTPPARLHPIPALPGTTCRPLDPAGLAPDPPGLAQGRPGAHRMGLSPLRFDKEKSRSGPREAGLTLRAHTANTRQERPVPRGWGDTTTLATAPRGAQTCQAPLSPAPRAGGRFFPKGRWSAELSSPLLPDGDSPPPRHSTPSRPGPTSSPAPGTSSTPSPGSPPIAPAGLQAAGTDAHRNPGP